MYTRLTQLYLFHVQPEDDHYQAPKHVVVPYVENTLYSTNKYSCVRPVHTLYIGYFIEHNGDDKPHDYSVYCFVLQLSVHFSSFMVKEFQEVNNNSGDKKFHIFMDR